MLGSRHDVNAVCSCSIREIVLADAYEARLRRGLRFSPISLFIEIQYLAGIALVPWPGQNDKVARARVPILEQF